MLRWSINLFRIRGIRLSLHWSFPILVVWAAYKGWTEGAFEGAAWSVAATLTCFACVVLHEMGHSLTAMRFGVNVRQILLTPIGGIAQFDRIPKRPSQELLITIAGPLVNFAIAALLWCFLDLPSGWNPQLAGQSLRDFGRIILWWNIGVGLFNLIPAFPMDGGRIVRALLAIRLPYLRATFWAASLGKLITVVGFIWELLKWQQADFFVIAICLMIFSAGEAEYQSVKRRESDEALWRESLLRHIASPPPVEPPVI
jgi:Zn-dependent protease